MKKQVIWQPGIWHEYECYDKLTVIGIYGHIHKLYAIILRIIYPRSIGSLKNLGILECIASVNQEF